MNNTFAVDIKKYVFLIYNDVPRIHVIINYMYGKSTSINKSSTNTFYIHTQKIETGFEKNNKVHI